MGAFEKMPHIWYSCKEEEYNSFMELLYEICKIIAHTFSGIFFKYSVFCDNANQTIYFSFNTIAAAGSA